jgi:hypothetical protein
MAVKTSFTDSVDSESTWRVLIQQGSSIAQIEYGGRDFC